MADLLEVTEANWDQEVLQSDKPVLVDFWASWCVPCQRLGPKVEQVAQEYSDRVKVAKCNVQDAGALASRYGIQGIPVLMLFKRGKVVDQVIGDVPKQKIIEKLDAHL